MDNQVFYCNAYINMDKVHKHLLDLKNKYGYGNIPIHEAMKFELEIEYLPCDVYS